jgi:hypothetical protein
MGMALGRKPAWRNQKDTRQEAFANQASNLGEICVENGKTD